MGLAALSFQEGGGRREEGGVAEGCGEQATAAADKTAPAPIPSPVGRSSFPADT